MDAAPTLNQLDPYTTDAAPPRSTSYAASGNTNLSVQLEQQRRLIEQHRQQLYNLLPAQNTAQLAPRPPQLQQLQQPGFFTSEDTNSPSSSSTSTPPWPQQRNVSNSRDEPALADIRSQYQQYQTDRQEHQVKRELYQQQQQQLQDPMAYNVDEKNASTSGSASQPALPARSTEDPMPSTSDFVKKLYKMLEDPSFQSVVCWGPLGDCFVVKDMNEFTKSILPRMFKHSNFASFVRQLNKYDFHKVKNTDDNQFGEHSWTFRHPDFHADRRDALENIKRKVPAARKYTPSSSSNAGPSAIAPAPASSTSQSYNNASSSSYPYPASSSAYPSSGATGNGRRSPSPTHVQLTAEIQRLKDEGDDLRGRIRNLERNYENVLVELVGFQRGMAQQDGLMQSLIGWFLEGGKPPKLITGSSNSASPESALQSPRDVPLLQASEAQLLQQQQQQQQQQGGGGGGSSIPQKLRQQLLQMQAESRSRSSSIGSGIYPPIQPSSLSEPGLFLPPQAVQQRAGQSPADIGRATLMQMNELSRRGMSAGESGRLWSGMDFNVGGNGFDAGASAGPSQEGAQPRSRAEQLAQIRDYYNQRQAAGSSSTSASASAVAGASTSRGRSLGRTSFSESRLRETSGPMPVAMEMDIASVGGVGGGSALDDDRGRRQRRSSDSVALAASRAMAEAQVQQQQQSPASVSSYSTDQPTPQWGPTPPFVDAPSSSSFSPQSQGAVGMGQYPSQSDNDLMTHEGLQVYTVGHLLPRNTYVEDAQGNWSFDPSALLSGGMLGGLRMGGVEGGQGQQQQQQPQPQPQPQQQDDEEEEVVRPSPSIPIGIPSSSSTSAHQSPELLTASTPGVKSGGTSGATQQKLRVRRSTFVPGWAVPPRVLLVDDDAVSRKLSSKFLKVFGCTTDVAVDGIGAVNKMNLEKYDLVLMDIVMPKLDGVSATSLIRKFDQGTPIISMTSNSKPNEIMTYYSSGMNDILPKPFTKEGLLDMLEKHLMHLKVIQQMSRLSRNIGIPPLSDVNFEQALTQGANNLLMLPPPPPSAASSPMNTALISSSGSSSSTPSAASDPNTVYNAPSPFSFQFFGDGDNDGMSMNPLAGMGLTDEQYSTILQNIVNGEGFSGMMDSGIGGMEGGEKRGRMDDMDDDRGGKRSRFEVVE